MWKLWGINNFKFIWIWNSQDIHEKQVNMNCFTKYRDYATNYVGSQEILRKIGKFGLGVQNKIGQRLTVLSREHNGHSKHPL